MQTDIVKYCTLVLRLRPLSLSRRGMRGNVKIVLVTTLLPNFRLELLEK